MEIEYDGVKRTVEIIGGFQLKHKDYAVCSYDDENDNHKVVIVQVVRDSAEMHTVDIPAEDKEEVLAAYYEMKKYVMEDEEDE